MFATPFNLVSALGLTTAAIAEKAERVSEIHVITGDSLGLQADLKRDRAPDVTELSTYLSALITD